MSGARVVLKIGGLVGNRVGEGRCAERVITEMGEGGRSIEFSWTSRGSLP